MTQWGRYVPLALLALVAGGTPRTGLASKPRLRLERVDTDRCGPDGLIRVFVTELELEGSLRTVPFAAFHLVVDSEASADAPLAAAHFEGTKEPLALAIVIQASLSYSDDMPQIKAALRGFVGRLPKRSRIDLLTYGWVVRTLLEDGDPESARGAIERIAISEEAGSLALVSACKQALSHLPQRGRRLLLVISDGLNRSLARETFCDLGDRAQEVGVPIHPIAYSATDERGPLLNLGEIAKRSGGTLRWARKPSDIGREFENLAREINNQAVLSYRFPSRCLRGHVIQISHGVLRSNEIKIAAYRKDSAGESGRGWLAVVVIGGGVLLSAIAVFLIIGFRRKP